MPVRPNSPLVALVALLALLLAAPAAQAAEWLDGDGWRVRVPNGFRDVEDAARGECLTALRTVLAKAGGARTQDLRILVEGEGQGPGILTLHLVKGEEAREASRNLAGLMQTAEATGALAGIDVQRTHVGAGYAALLLQSASLGPDGTDWVVRRALVEGVADGEERMIDFCLSGPLASDGSRDAAWHVLLGTVRFGKESWLSRLPLPAPFLAAGLVGLLGLGILARILLRPSPARASLWVDTSPVRRGYHSGAQTASRALDGLPLYSEKAPGEASRAPAPAPPPSSESADEDTSPSALVSALERSLSEGGSGGSPVRTAPAGAPLARPTFVRPAPARAAPPGPARETPDRAVLVRPTGARPAGDRLDARPGAALRPVRGPDPGAMPDPAAEGPEPSGLAIKRNDEFLAAPDGRE